MRDCYDGLLSAAAATANSAYGMLVLFRGSLFLLRLFCNVCCGFVIDMMPNLIDAVLCFYAFLIIFRVLRVIAGNGRLPS